MHYGMVWRRWLYTIEPLSICCVMTPGLGKDIRCHVWPYSFLCLHITRSDIRLHLKWAVSLVMAHGHWIFHTWVCVGMNELTYPLYHPSGLGKTFEKKVTKLIYVYLFAKLFYKHYPSLFRINSTTSTHRTCGQVDKGTLIHYHQT